MPTELDTTPETSDNGSQNYDSPPPDRDRPEVSAGNGGQPADRDTAPETPDGGTANQDSPPPHRDRPDVSTGEGGHPSSPGDPEVGFEPFDPRGPQASDYEAPHFGHLPGLPEVPSEDPRKGPEPGERSKQEVDGYLAHPPDIIPVRGISRV
jgi:hypothetical protein